MPLGASRLEVCNRGKRADAKQIDRSGRSTTRQTIRSESIDTGRGTTRQTIRSKSIKQGAASRERCPGKVNEAPWCRRDRAAGTQQFYAGARKSFRPLPRAGALDRDVALSPTRVQKDQVVAKVGSHCAARGGGVRCTTAHVGRVRALYAPGAGASAACMQDAFSLPAPRAKTRSRAAHGVGVAPGP